MRLRDGTGPNHEKFMAMRAKMLREKVGLTEDTATKVEAILDEYRAKRFEVKDRINLLTVQLETLLTDGTTSDAVLAQATLELRNAYAELHDLKTQEWEVIGEVTTPREQARMIVIMHQLQFRMGRGGKGMGGMGRGMGPGPGPDFDY